MCDSEEVVQPMGRLFLYDNNTKIVEKLFFMVQNFYLINSITTTMVYYLPKLNFLLKFPFPYYVYDNKNK